MLVHFETYSCYGTQEKLARVRENYDKIKRQQSIKMAERNS